LSGDLGNSFIFGRPALSLIAERFPATIELATCALFIAVVIGLPLGIYAGLNPKGLGARMIMGGICTRPFHSNLLVRSYDDNRIFSPAGMATCSWPR
jgi:ABC-type spermidine/putrescine transport system permease subunit I